MLIKTCIHVDLFTVKHNMKKIIITGCPRTGSTALALLISSSPFALVTNEVGTFHHSKRVFDKKVSKFFGQEKKILNFESLNKNKLLNFSKSLDGNVVLFGDKRPDYCASFTNMLHLIEKHQDAYFVFTHRNPCATAWSFLKRTKIEPNVKVAWCTDNIETAATTIVNRTNNWLSTLYPNVKNKMIVCYDNYINNQKKLVNDLESFFGESLNITHPEEIYAHKNPNDFKLCLSDDQINQINIKFSILKEKIDSIKK